MVWKEDYRNDRTLGTDGDILCVVRGGGAVWHVGIFANSERLKTILAESKQGAMMDCEIFVRDRKESDG